jgi:HCOMODA/2-hydroxy-3-carboxy-muconic semialdehyde decarboxylase
MLMVANPHAAMAQETPASCGPVSATIVEDLVAANRILVAEGVLDAYGHVSVRHPSNPNYFATC